MFLDLTGFKLLKPDGWWRYVCHKRKLATTGFSRRTGAIKNGRLNGYADNPVARSIMSKRYADLFPEGKC